MAKNKVNDEYTKLKESVKTLLQTPDGRVFLTWLLAESRVYKQSFAADDKGYTAFNEGQRCVGLKVLRLCEEHPRQHLAMMEADLRERELADEERQKKLKQRGQTDENFAEDEADDNTD